MPERSLTDKILGRWYAPTPKRHRFTSGLNEPPEKWRNAVPSLITFAGAKLFHAYQGGRPWLPYGVVRYIPVWLGSHARVLEIGSGASTVYFARRAQHVVSVERNPEWRARTAQMIRRAGVTNVELMGDLPADLNQFSFILLDDEPREALFDTLWEALAEHGYLLVDNWDWPRYDRVRGRRTPTHVIADFAPYNFSVSTSAVFYKAPRDGY